MLHLICYFCFAWQWLKTIKNMQHMIDFLKLTSENEKQIIRNTYLWMLFKHWRQTTKKRLCSWIDLGQLYKNIYEICIYIYIYVCVCVFLSLAYTRFGLWFLLVGILNIGEVLWHVFVFYWKIKYVVLFV